MVASQDRTDLSDPICSCGSEQEYDTYMPKWLRMILCESLFVLGG